MRGMMIAAALALGLAACNQQPALPKAEEGSANAPSEQHSAAADGQALLTAEQRTQLEGMMKTYLDRSQSNNAQGLAPAPGFTDHVAGLQPGTDDRWQVDLVGGTGYRIIGACDNECSNLDIEVIDARGGVVASDMAPDDFPAVTFTPTANGRYFVRTLMQTCTVAPCYAGVRILKAS